MKARAIVVLAALAIPREADACECNLPLPSLEAPARAPLPPDPTLYLFIEEGWADRLAPAITATQAGEAREVEVDEVFKSAKYSVRRVHIHAGPGPLELKYLDPSVNDEPTTLQIGIAREAAPLPSLLYAGFDASGHQCAEAFGFSVEMTGHGAAAMQLRGIDRDGVPHVAYFPVRPAYDDEGIPRPDGQAFRIGSSGCGTDYFNFEEVESLRHAELVSLGTDGSARTIARGYVTLDSRGGQLPTWLGPSAVASAPPPAPSPPVARASVVSWRTAAAAGGGLTVGATLMFLVARRRRR